MTAINVCINPREVIEARFTVVSDGMFGYKSFKIDRDWADSKSSFVAAHDLLEHMPDDRGTHCEEFAALGAGFWVRQNYYYSADRNWDVFISDMIGTFNGFDRRDWPNWPEPPVPYINDSVFTENLDRNMRSSYNFRYMSSGPWDTQYRKVMGWAQFGYYRAKERYPNRDAIGDFFRVIENTIERYKNKHHGTKFDVMVEPDTFTFVASLVDPATDSDYVRMQTMAAGFNVLDFKKASEDVRKFATEIEIEMAQFKVMDFKMPVMEFKWPSFDSAAMQEMNRVMRSKAAKQTAKPRPVSKPAKGRFHSGAEQFRSLYSMPKSREHPFKLANVKRI